MSERQTKAGNQENSLTLSHSHSRHDGQLLFSCLYSKVSLSHSHSLTLSLFHSLIHALSTCRTTFVFMSMVIIDCLQVKMTNNAFLGHHQSSIMSMLKSHFSHSLTLTLSISHPLNLKMLNNFCFHVQAQKSLFIDENDYVFFDSFITLSCEFRVHRAGSQLKIPLRDRTYLNSCQTSLAHRIP